MEAWVEAGVALEAGMEAAMEVAMEVGVKAGVEMSYSWGKLKLGLRITGGQVEAEQQHLKGHY